MATDDIVIVRPESLPAWFNSIYPQLEATDPVASNALRNEVHYRLNPDKWPEGPPGGMFADPVNLYNLVSTKFGPNLGYEFLAGSEGQLTPEPTAPPKTHPGFKRDQEFAGPPSWWVSKPPEKPKDTSVRDYMQQVAYNRAIPFMDPITQRTTALWLARDNPDTWSKYANLSPIYPSTGQHTPTVPPGTITTQEVAPPAPRTQLTGNILMPPKQPSQQLLSQSMIDYITNELDFNKIKAALPASAQAEIGKTENKIARQESQAALTWLQEALKTARAAAPGSTRGQQQLAAEHLATLMREAETEPARAGGYKTLMENLLNPVTRQAPLSGIFGGTRALKLPSGEFRRRGVAFRNPQLV